MSNEAVNLDPQVESEINESGEQESHDPSSAKDVVSKVINSQTNEPLSKEQNEQIKEELFNLLIDGQEKKFNLKNEQDKTELKRLAQLGGAGHKRMQEAAGLRKEVDGLLAELKQNPSKVLHNLGLDVNKFAEQVIQQEIERMQKSPEQLQRELEQKELQSLRDQINRDKQEKDRDQAIFYQEQAAQQLDKEITSEMSKHPDFPKTPYAVSRIAAGMMWAMENGYPDVTVADIVPRIKDQLNGEIRNHLSSIPEDIIEKYLGSEISERLRKERIKKSKAASVPSSKKIESTGADVKKNMDKPKEKITMRQFLYGDAKKK